MKHLLFVLLAIQAPFLTFSQDKKGIYKDPAFIQMMLEQHNGFRTAVGVPDLKWSNDLAMDAWVWASQLANGNTGRHDPEARAKSEGENIWWGTAGAFKYEVMVGAWGGEKKDFAYGVFPDCRRRKSAVVGHYTQMIWKTTSTVGCALTSNGKMDFLVCRYSSPGNIEGQKPY